MDPQAFERVHDEVHARRGVRREGDLVGLGAYEPRHVRARPLAPREPVLPEAVARLHRLAVEALRRLAHAARDGTRARAVEVRVILRDRELGAHARPAEIAFGGGV